MKKTFEILENETGERADLFLVKIFPDFTRSQIQKLFSLSKVLINSKETKPSQKLKKGDVVDIDSDFLKKMADEPLFEAKAEKINLNILYENDDLLVVEKPAGMVVHPAYGNTSGTLVNALLSHDPQIANALIDENQYSKSRPGIVHRLDKDTSGVVIVAKNLKALSSLGKQIKNHTVKKIYYALVLGWADEKGQISVAIKRDPKYRKIMAVAEDGKEAITKYTTEKYFSYKNEKLSLVRCELVTGRTHQIRLHMKHIGHPIIGDQTYNSKKSLQISSSLNLERQFLHASEITFHNPSDNKIIFVKSELPNDLTNVLSDLEEVKTS